MHPPGKSGWNHRELAKEAGSRWPIKQQQQQHGVCIARMHDAPHPIGSNPSVDSAGLGRGSSKTYPPLGPNPLLLSRAEVDELYDLLASVLSALDELIIPHALIAGSLLGAVRSQSILFNDDDVDIAIIDDWPPNSSASSPRPPTQSPYELALERLPGLLSQKADERSKSSAAEARAKGSLIKVPPPVKYIYQRRTWPGCDRIKSSVSSRIWVDLFVLRKYESHDDLLRTISIKENGLNQPQEYIDGIVRRMGRSPENGGNCDQFSNRFPLYHFDNRKAIELWPREYLLPSELFPIRKDFKFGPLTVPVPTQPISTLLRFFGSDCFTHYVKIEHTRGKRVRGDTPSWEQGSKVALADDQYLPVQHSRRKRRVWSRHNKSRLEEFVAHELAEFAQTRNCAIEDNGVPSGFGSSKKLLKYFGAAVRLHTVDSSDTPDFNRALRQVMEPHIVKARLNREQSWKQQCDQKEVPYRMLRTEQKFFYDVNKFPLHQLFADIVGVEDLSLMHEDPERDKAVLVQGLLDREIRQPFHECFDTFVTSFCIPLLHSIALNLNAFATKEAVQGVRNSITYRYQAFPCIRVNRPGEFSLGPHCDITYGHSIGNINFHIPLTATCGTNALYSESGVGKEDWHPLLANAPGLGYIFDGARCIHFTLENTTDRTRVSLDFRIAITKTKGDEGDRQIVEDVLCCETILHDRMASAGPGFYEEAVVDLGEDADAPVVVKKRSNSHFVEPDYRVGFPFTRKKENRK